jgi:hypothetical protein
MTIPSYTPVQLLARVKTLEEFLPISSKIGLSRHHDSHRDHWIKWLREYDGPGYYNRKNANRDAAYIYSHVQSAGMVVYLGEAAGVSTNVVTHAFIVATTSPGNRSAVTAATRRIMPWAMVCRSLWPTHQMG